MSSESSRRSGRIPKQIAISVIGSDMEGRVFSEQTKTVVLSRHGAGITSTFKLSAEQELVIRNEESRKEIEARVVGQIGADGDRYIYGIAFLDESINFWGVEFPAMSESEIKARRTLLQCGSCQRCEFADHSDLASDVMAINQSIMRYCKRCGFSTLWTPAPAGATPTSDAPGPSAGMRSTRGISPTDATVRASSFGGAAFGQDDAPGRVSAATLEPAATREPVAPRASATEGAREEAPAATPVKPAVAAKTQENRRKHARTRVNYKACVRRADAPDDVVACEDMSRGGLRFKSSKKYFEKALIQVAVPYTPGDQAIFVSAQIVYVQELPEQKLYRCGVMYLRK